MQKNEFYCKRRNEEYNNFFKGKSMVKMCGAKPEEIIKVRVVEDENGNYYAIYDLQEDAYYFVFPSLVQLKVCSPDGFKNKISEGKVKIVRLRVEVIE